MSDDTSEDATSEDGTVDNGAAMDPLFEDGPVDSGPAENGPADDGSDSSETAPSIFDLFEPPPEAKSESFGPIPVVPSPSEELGSPPIEGWDIPTSNRVETPEVTSDGAEATSVDESKSALPDWSAPATGQIPAALASESPSDGWSDLDGPRWHGQDPEWATEDLREVFKDVDGVSTPKTISFDDVDTEAPALPEAAGAPQREDRIPEVKPPLVRQRARPRVGPTDTGERNVPQAIAVGVALAAMALVAIKVKSDLPLLAIITVALGLAVSEIYLKMREIGLHPATLLGLTSAVSFPLAVYYRGTQAFGLVMSLTMVFGALWYLVGADSHKPALNLGLTLLGVVWVGVLGSFAVLLTTAIEGSHNLVLAAIVVTVASDVGAFAGGRMYGRTPFHPASGKKTWEGTLTGVALAVAAALVLWIVGIEPIGGDAGGWTHALALGLVGGVLAPLGDLTESMVKRDLGTKDMGAMIPGHGGVMDRLDGMLFVIPGVYYLSLLLGYI